MFFNDCVKKLHQLKAEHARRLAVVNRDDRILDERTPLLSSTEASLNLSRREIIRNNFAALATIALSLVISNALFPGITSQFHGNYNCSTATHPNLSASFAFSDTPTHPYSPTTNNTSACE